MRPDVEIARTPPEAAPDRRWLALAVLCAGTLMIILDGSIVTVAMPSIQRDLGFTPGSLTWTVNAYMVPFGGLMLLSGRLGDLLGRKRVFLTGLAVFTAASLACGLATSQAALITARFVQGAGGALVTAVSLGMIAVLFPEPGPRARAMGAFAFVGAAGASIGQIVGGILTQALNWHWIFLINLPIGLAAGLLALRYVAADRGQGLRGGADLPGAALVTGGLILGVYAIVTSAPWLGGAAVLLLAGFAVREATAARPLLPPRVFRSRTVSGANVVQLLLVAAGFGFQVSVTLFVQQVLGYGALDAGLALTPVAVGIGAVSLFLSAPLVQRLGARPVLVTGLLLLLLGLFLLSRVPADASYAADILPALLPLAGFGLAQPALLGLGMSGAADADAGVISGLLNTSQQAGAALGVAVLSTLAASRTADLLASGHARPESLTGGFHLAFLLAAGCLALATAVSLVVLRKP